MWMMEPPPSQGRMRNPLESILALTKLEESGPLGPPVAAVSDFSQTWKDESILYIREENLIKKENKGRVVFKTHHIASIF